jgi:hypothetical protein
MDLSALNTSVTLWGDTERTHPKLSVEKIYLSNTVIRIIREELLMTQKQRVELKNLRISGETPSHEGQSRVLYRETATLPLSESADVVKIQL